MVRSEERPRESPRRRAVWDVLRAAAGGVAAAEVATRLGVHPNTARAHLDTLVDRGLAARVTEAPSGPGRPRIIYTARSRMDPHGPRNYRALAEMLLSRLASEGRPEEAQETGRAWGRHLVERMAPFRTPTATDAVRRLTAMLADLGFDPDPPVADRRGEPDTARIRLRNCPFLELAENYAATVCSLHLGLMQGALDELGGPVRTSGLDPFADDGACVAHLASLARPSAENPTL